MTTPEAPRASSGHVSRIITATKWARVSVPLQFDNKISLGHVISVVMMLVTGTMAWANLRADQDRMLADVTRMQAEDAARESRLRSLEIAQATASSDLRSIQVGISEIKAQLDKMQRPGGMQ